jgi:glycosyltransferase involved in cell wall biosynthesis
MTRRLLFVTQTAHVHGGLETWLDELLPTLPARGWQPLVALARGPRFHDPEAYRAAHPTFETIEVEAPSNTREARVAALRTMIRRVNPELVVPVNIADTNEAVAREKLAGSNVRLLLMLRAMRPHGELEDMRRWRDFVDVAVGGNRLLRALIAEWARIPEHRLRYIPPGSRRKTGETRTPRPAGRLRIGYVGRLDAGDKRVLDLIALAQSLDDLGVAYDLTIAGDGPARETLDRALGQRARFMGEVPVDELYANVFPNLDVLVLFSTAEAGPQVVWQAMHYGVVPVVSRYRGAAAENVLREGETALLFAIGDTHGAARQIATLDDELLRKLSAAAERAVDPEYLLDDSLKRWAGVFDEAVSLPTAIGTSLPLLAPSGVYERLHLPPRASYALRRLMHRIPMAEGPGDEWPHHGAMDAETIARIDKLAEELDRPFVPPGVSV